MTNNGKQHAFAKSIDAVLKRSASTVQQVGALAWRLGFAERGIPAVDVRVDSGWCQLCAPLRTRRTASVPGSKRMRGLLRRNAALPANINYCVTTQAPKPLLAAEFAVETDGILTADVCGQLGGSIEAFKGVLSCRAADRSADRSPSGGESDDPPRRDGELREEIKSLCLQTHWEFNEHADGQLAITLDVPHQFCQAFVDSSDGVACRLWAGLETPARVAAGARHAMDLFLLTASRIVRMARATVALDDATPGYRWEVVWPEPPDASELQCGLSALSVACQLTARELPVLGDESIANAYLRLRGLSS